MTGTNSSNEGLILFQNVEINSNEYFSYDIFSGMESSTMWNGNAIAQSQRKMSLNSGIFEISPIYDLSNDDRYNFSFIHHLLQLFMSFSFFLKDFVITEALFTVKCVVVDVNKPWGTDAPILKQHWPFMSIKYLYNTQQVGQVTRDGVPMLANPFNWPVFWPWSARELLCSRSDQRYHSRRLLAHYHLREVRNSLYQYQKIHIDYHSKCSYQFISIISIIYGNTTERNETHRQLWLSFQ